MVDLRANEAAVMKALQNIGGNSSFEELASVSGQDNASATRALAVLQEKQLVRVSESDEVTVRLTEEGIDYAKRGLPERRLVQAVLDLGGETLLEQAMKHADIPQSLASVVLGWVKNSRWCDVSTQLDKVVLKASAIPDKTNFERTLELIASKPESTVGQLPSDLRSNIETLKRRRLLVS
jgi:phenylalanyl-tRNA synthetase alpha chain